MARLLIRFKLFPKEVGIDLKSLADQVARSLPDGVSLAGTEEEPIAFGLIALIVNINAEEREGVMDAVEEALRSIDTVSEIQYLAAGRISTAMK